MVDSFYVCVRDVNNSELITLLTLHQHRTCAWVVSDDAKRMCKNLYKNIEGYRSESSKKNLLYGMNWMNYKYSYLSSNARR